MSDVIWKCPDCKRERYGDEKLVLKICYCCQIKMVKMECQKCKKDYFENLIQESHDVPCYLFSGKHRSDRKNKADKFPRHNLCEKCHDKYEEKLRIELIACAFKFATKYFEDIK